MQLDMNNAISIINAVIAFIILLIITVWFLFTGIQGILTKKFNGELFRRYEKKPFKRFKYKSKSISRSYAIVLSIRNILFGIFFGLILYILLVGVFISY